MLNDPKMVGEYTAKVYTGSGNSFKFRAELSTPLPRFPDVQYRGVSGCAPGVARQSGDVYDDQTPRWFHYVGPGPMMVVKTNQRQKRAASMRSIKRRFDGRRKSTRVSFNFASTVGGVLPVLHIGVDAHGRTTTVVKFVETPPAGTPVLIAQLGLTPAFNWKPKHAK